MVSQKELDEVVARVGEKLPAPLRERLARAKGLIGNIRVASPQSDGSVLYLVYGSKGDPYEVEFSPSGATRCSCPDGRRGLTSHCKHQLAVLIWRSLPGLKPLDPGDFEKDIRRWLLEPRKDPSYWDGEIETLQESPQEEWLRTNGRFAIQVLIDEIDRLRALSGDQKSRLPHP